MRGQDGFNVLDWIVLDEASKGVADGVDLSLARTM